MIGRQLFEPVAAEAIDAAVADVDDGASVVPVDDERCDRRAHAVERGVHPRQLEDPPVRAMDSLDQLRTIGADGFGAAGRPSAPAAAHVTDDRFDGRLAGALTAGMTAH